MSNAGGQFRLTCGQIGAGKSYLYVKQVEEEAKKSGKYQHIYSNIRAHAELAEGITPLPDSWDDCETDSLVIWDEVQMHEKYSKHFSTRRDGEIAGLTMIRHKRIDVWMISPQPTLVNKDVRDLVNQYFWLEPVGQKMTKCFCFDKVYVNMTKSVKNNAYDEFTYPIEEKYHKLYKSTEDGKPSGRNFNINMKLISFIVGMIIVCLIIGGLILYLSKSTKNNVNKLQETETKNSKNKEVDLKTGSGIMPTTGELTSEECRKGINVDKPECVKYFNTLTENRMSVGDLTVEYDPNKPYQQEEIQKVVSKTYQVKAKPVFSGCMLKNGRYVAYTQQGTILNDVSQDDCKKLMNGDRPFNYFASNSEQQTLQNQQLNTHLNKPNLTQEEYFKYMQYIESKNMQNNNVDSRLQATVTNGANDQAGFNNKF